MGKAVVIGAALALVAATGASAQAPGAPYPPPGAGQPIPGPTPDGGRWGSEVDGRWWGGADAPGGWDAYRTPYRGYHLPGYWTGARFQIDDYDAYGFPAPPAGYHWSRYYDDAVLADGRGDVYDWRGGVDWRGRPLSRHEQKRLGRRYEAGPGYPSPPPPPPPPVGPAVWHSPDGATTVTVTTGGGPVYAGPPVAYAYGYGAGGSVTTVTVQTAPVVTTTTTEIIDDAVYTRPAVHRVYVRKRVWHPKRRRPCVIGS